MIEEAKETYSKLTAMRSEDVSSLDVCSDPTVSSLKYSYWCRVMSSHLKLISSTDPRHESSRSTSSKMSTITPIQEAYKELTAAIDLIKKQSTGGSGVWTLDHRIRILFLKAHQDYISGNINTAKSQLFQTHRHYKSPSNDSNDTKPEEQSIGFLNNMACIYAVNDECGSAMSLIHRALSLHAQFMDQCPLYAADHMISYLCYNSGLFLQNLGQYARAVDSLLCCLPVLQSKPRLWLRMAQCVLAIWEPHGGYEHHKEGQPGLNALVHDVIEADSTRRGDLYLLPIGRRNMVYNHIDFGLDKKGKTEENQNEQNGDTGGSKSKIAHLQHVLKWHERDDAEYSFPYSSHKSKERERDNMRQKRWIKRKEKQSEFCAKTEVIVKKLNEKTAEKKKKEKKNKRHVDGHTGPSTPTSNSGPNEAIFEIQRDNNEMNRKQREKRMYQKEKIRKREQLKRDSEEYQSQRRELKDMKLAIEWLKNAIMLFKRREEHFGAVDVSGHISAHLHLAYCYLKLKAWNYALRHAEYSLTLYQKQQIEQKTAMSSHETYLARMYAAEALVHLNKFNQAIKHLLPKNFPHITAHHDGDKSAVQTPKSSKSASFPSKEEEENGKRSGMEKGNGAKLEKSNLEHKERFRAHDEKRRSKKEKEQYLAVLVNLATTYICRGALEGAHKCIYKALSMDDGYYPAMRMLVYLQMRMGNNNEAIRILKHRRPIPVKQLIQQSDAINGCA